MTARGLRGILVLSWLAMAPAWAQDLELPPPMSSRVGAPSLLSPDDRRIFQEAFGHARAGRYDRARARAEVAEAPLPAKIILWFALSESERDGDFAERVAFLRQNPDWPNQFTLRRGAEATMPEDLADREVLDWFQARPPLTTEGALRFAEALSRAGAQDTALLRRIWIRHDLTARQARSFRKRYAGRLRREDEIARLDRLLGARKFAPAKRQARRLGGGYPALAAARQRLARGRKGVDAAIRRVPSALRNNPGLIFERARWRKRKGLESGAIALLDGLTPAPSQAKRWWPLRRWAARRSLLLGDASAAYRIAAGHGLDSGLKFAEGEWLAGWIALRFLDAPEIGFGHFTRLYGKVGKPISLARAAFWAGEAAQAIDRARTTALEQSSRDSSGDSSLDEAWQWYATAATHGTIFYGQLARQRLGRAPSIVLPGPATPDAESRAAFGARELVRVVRILGELGETKLQKKFLQRLGTAATTDAGHALVAELAIHQGRPDLAFGVARVALTKGFLLPDYLFPAIRLPEQDDAEPALVLALIRQESGFYARAISRARARGLMQILPRTAQRVARRIGVKYSRRRLTADPDYNLRLGLAYLSDLIQRYEGSYILALAAYNAGPPRIDRWLRELGDPRDSAVNQIDWIERIPFSETRNYVQRVLEGMVVYRQLSAANIGAGSQIWHFSASPASSVQEGHRAPFREHRRAPRAQEFPPG